MKQAIQTINDLFDKAKIGDTESQFLLAVELSKDKNNDASIEKAFRLFKQFAYAGNTEAQFILGRFYEGEYGDKYLDYQEAFYWYKQASEKNHTQASEAIANLTKDKNLRIKTEDLANKGNIKAMYWLAYRSYSQTDYKGANGWLDKACRDSRRSHGLLRLRAYMYSEERGFGDMRNALRNETLDYYYKSASKGNTEAQYLLGMYWSVEGSLGLYNRKHEEPFHDEAFPYFLSASQNGHRDAQVHLAFAYHNGLGVGQNYPEAFSWLYKAAYATPHCIHNDAAALLAEYYTKKWVFEKPDYIEAMIWYSISEKLHGVDEVVSGLMKIVNSKLKPEERCVANNEAKYRLGLLQTQGALGPYSVDELDPIIADILTPKKTKLTDIITNYEAIDSQNIGDIETSITPDFIHIDKIIKKNFDPSKIKITLVVGEERKDVDDPDFKYIVFSYGSYHDKKSIDVFSTPEFKIHPEVRKLLLKLAIQYRNKDVVLRQQNIAAILKSPDCDATYLSLLNTMVREAFPDRFRTKQSNLIDRKAGKLKIPIYIHDIWNTQNCKDYPLLERI